MNKSNYMLDFLVVASTFEFVTHLKFKIFKTNRKQNYKSKKENNKKKETRYLDHGALARLTQPTWAGNHMLTYTLGELPEFFNIFRSSDVMLRSQMTSSLRVHYG